MNVRYALTIRPAWAENVPAGFTKLQPSVAPRPGRYHGFVEYAEPLDRKVAEHFSLRPLGPEIYGIHTTDGTHNLYNVLGHEAAEVEYLFGTYQLTWEEVEAKIRKAVEAFETELVSVDLYEPPKEEACSDA